MSCSDLLFIKEVRNLKSVFRLNDFYLKNNVLAGSHDPSMMYDENTKKYYSYSTDINGEIIGIKDKIGIPIRSSENLVDFKYEGIALSEKSIKQAQDNGKYEKTINFWAPFVEYINDEYRLYYSATRAFGSSESKIWLAVSDNPLGPFENRGVVIDTWGTDNTYPNGIDPHIIWSENKCFLVYGSFFGGIYLKELNPKNGMPLDNNPKNLGKCIARKAKNPRIDGPEGASIIYVKQTGYYYLFLSYGWLGENYDIRVGRSKTVDGDYLDINNKNLIEESMGLKIANSYCFKAEIPAIGNDNPNWKWSGFMANGHGVPFFDPVRNQYFFVHHVRDGAEIYKKQDENRAYYTNHYMMIRPMFFINGWPVLSPEPFADENFKEICLEKTLKDCFNSTIHKWEFIFLDDQNNDKKHSVVKTINLNNKLLKQGKIHLCWDFENQKQTFIITGINQFGVAYWGKLLYNSIIDFSKILL